MTEYKDLIAEGLADERELVFVQRHTNRAVVTLSEPERLNPLSSGLMAAAACPDAVVQSRGPRRRTQQVQTRRHDAHSDDHRWPVTAKKAA